MCKGINRRRLVALFSASLVANTWMNIGLIADELGLIAEESETKQWSKDYRHIHKKQVAGLNLGEPDDVIAASTKMLEEFPTDAESLFFLALGHSHAQRPAEAAAAMGRALHAGLPPARFVVGPKSWTRPLNEIPEFAPIQQRLENRIIHGPMMGHVTHESISIWVRTVNEAKVQVLYSTNSNLEPATLSETQTTRQASDGTAVVRLVNLRPNTTYYYDVLIEGRRQFEGHDLRFKTAAPANSATKFTIAFGGGAAYWPVKERMWRTIAKQKPEFLLLLGDNVYVDDPENDNYHRYLYYRRQSQPDFRRLLRSTPVYAIWDDHDFGDNDSAGGPAVDSPAWKISVWEIFKQNWCNPYYGGGKESPGCWFDFTYGDVQFLMLDGRYYRTRKKDNPRATPTMLGPVQKNWLKEKLSQSKAKVKVLCSPVPWIGGNPDKWTGFAEERDEIFSWIEEQQIEGVILMSADRHRSDLLTYRHQGHRYFEFMSSRLTNFHTHRLATEKDGAIFSYNEKCSFGLVSFDTTGADPIVRFDVRSIDDEQIFRFETKIVNEP